MGVVSPHRVRVAGTCSDRYLRDPSISYEDIRKSIISTIGSLDSPMTPADKG